jgi:hypothetical protein
MSRRLVVVAVGAVTLLVTFATPGAAPAAGGKGVLGYGANFFEGVVDPGSGGRFLALTVPGGTLVQRIDTADGSVHRTRFLRSEAVIPAVAYDGSPGGLSNDGDTLVLAEPAFRFPQRDSVFTVIDTSRLRPTDTVTLDGTWTYDALSPDGRWLYLIEYTSPRDITQYEVRRYDLTRGRLDPQPIVDPEESSEEMYGSPMTRATSPDGRWAYTLYDGAEHPFIHALDTERGEAACIDLDPGAVPPRRLFRMTLDPSPDGSTLTVTDPKEGPVAIVDTKSFEVREPGAEPPPITDAGGDDSGGAPWLLIALGGLAVAGATLAVVRWRRPRSVDSDDLEELVRVEPESQPSDGRGQATEQERDWHRVS